MIRTTTRERDRLIDEDEYALVVNLFITTNDNATSVICKKLNLGRDMVHLIINHYISTLKIGIKWHEFD